MTTIGYIQFQRDILARPWAKKDSEAVHVFLYLLCEAAFEQRQEMFAGKPIMLEVGQLITGREKIAERTAVHPSKVQRILKKLEEFGEIEQQTSNVSRLISINCAVQRTTGEQRANNGRTTNEQQMNNGRTLYKEVNKERSKEGKEGATPAPPISSISNFPISTNDPAFDLLRRIGKPAAQIWTTIRGDETFGEKTALALEWMEVRCRIGRPFCTHQEFTALSKLFAQHTADEIRTMIDYSAGKYPDLYPDRLKRAKNSQSQQRLNLDPNDLENSRQKTVTTASGLKLVK